MTFLKWFEWLMGTPRKKPTPESVAQELQELKGAREKAEARKRELNELAAAVADAERRARGWRAKGGHP